MAQNLLKLMNVGKQTFTSLNTDPVIDLGFFLEISGSALPEVEYVMVWNSTSSTDLIP